MTHDTLHCDVLVIGGGINGCGIARDAAQRGFKVLLVEKHDFGWGASGNSSGTIHGGPRYLMNDVDTTRLSCVESGYVQRIAPHLLFRIPFLVPALKDKGQTQARWLLELMETYFEGYDQFQPHKRGKPHLRLSAREVRELEPGLTDDIAGAVAIDEWGIDAYRLCIANLTAAARNNAQVLNHTELIEVLREPGRVVGAVLQKKGRGRPLRVHTPWIVNATGAWAPQIAARAGCRVKLRPGKGIHLVLDRRVSNIGMIVPALDGRDIFIMPHQNNSWIGTTDDDYFGDPDAVPVLEDEVAYLFASIERYFPAVRQARVIKTMAGLRPTLYAFGPNEDGLSREHQIVDHEITDGLTGFLSLGGGKLASYRSMAEELVDVLCKKNGLDRSCTTHIEPLPGGEGDVNIERRADLHQVPALSVAQQVRRHGTWANRLFERYLGDARERQLLCACENVSLGEAHHVIRNEWVDDLADLGRRCRVGWGPCRGARCIPQAAALIGQANGWNSAEQGASVHDYFQKAHVADGPALGGPQLAQVEYLSAVVAPTVRRGAPTPVPFPAFTLAAAPFLPPGGPRAEDVVVVGTGFAGLTAALWLRHRGFPVTVVGEGVGLSGLVPGFVRWGGGENLVRNLPNRSPGFWHGTGDLDGRLATMLAWLKAALPAAGFRIGADLRVPMQWGAMAPAVAVPQWFPCVAASKRPLGLLAYDYFPDYDAKYLAATLAEQLGRDISVIRPLYFRRKSDAFLPAGHFGQSLKDPLALEVFCRGIQEAAGGKLPSLEELWIPPAFGVLQTPQIQAELQKRLGLEVFELGWGAGNLQGLRLLKVLHAACEDAGITVLKAKVGAVAAHGTTVREVFLQGSGVPPTIKARHWVWATGRFVGGGMGESADGKSGLHCGVLDLPLGLENVLVERPLARRLADGAEYAASRLNQVGVVTDESLHPLGSGGEVRYENLFVTGDLLALPGADRGQFREGLALLAAQRLGEVL